MTIPQIRSNIDIQIRQKTEPGSITNEEVSGILDSILDISGRFGLEDNLLTENRDVKLATKDFRIYDGDMDTGVGPTGSVVINKGLFQTVFTTGWNNTGSDFYLTPGTFQATIKEDNEAFLTRIHANSHGIDINATAKNLYDGDDYSQIDILPLGITLHTYDYTENGPNDSKLVIDLNGVLLTQNTNQGLSNILFPRKSGSYFVPITVNNVSADEFGNIAIEGGGTGGGGRFGIEDNISDVERSFDTHDNTFLIQNTGSTRRSFAMLTSSYYQLYSENTSSYYYSGFIVGETIKFQQTDGVASNYLVMPINHSGADRFIPFSVNNQYADAAGNIVIPTGDGAQFRFGVEDTSSVNREVVSGLGHIALHTQSYIGLYGENLSTGAYSNIVVGNSNTQIVAANNDATSTIGMQGSVFTLRADDNNDTYSEIRILPNGQLTLTSAKDALSIENAFLLSNTEDDDLPMIIQSYLTGDGSSIQRFARRDGEYYIPLTINNIAADSTGNVTVIGGGASSLQLVTEVGRVTDRGLIAKDFTLGEPTGSTLGISPGSLTSEQSVDDDDIYGGILELKDYYSSFSSQIRARNLTATRLHMLQNKSGTIAHLDDIVGSEPSLKFGVEDNIANENRLMHMNAFAFEISEASTVRITDSAMAGFTTDGIGNAVVKSHDPAGSNTTTLNVTTDKVTIQGTYTGGVLRYLPLSVNNVFASTSGNITVSFPAETDPFFVSQGIYKNGVAGGQTLYGGTASGQTLTLGSTINSVKGKILFGNSTYDEVNNRLGLGITSPTETFQIFQANTAGTGTVSTTAASTNVTGTGTVFLTSLQVGYQLIIAGQTVTVTDIISNTQITLNAAMTTSNTNIAYSHVNGTRFYVSPLSGTTMVGKSLLIQRQDFTANYVSLTYSLGGRLYVSRPIQFAVGMEYIYNGSSSASYYQVGMTGHRIGQYQWGNNSFIGLGFNQPTIVQNFSGSTSSLLSFTATIDNRIGTDPTTGLPTGNVSATAGDTIRGLHTTLTDNSPTILNTLIGVYADVGLGTNTKAKRYAGLFLGGGVGIGITAPTARLHLAVGTTLAGSAPIKLTTASAALMTTPEAGSIETNGSNLYWTNNSGVRTMLGTTGSSGWGFSGDSITSGQFIGTTNNEALLFKVNSNLLGTLDTDGKLKLNKGMHVATEGGLTDGLGAFYVKAVGDATGLTEIGIRPSWSSFDNPAWQSKITTDGYHFSIIPGIYTIFNMQANSGIFMQAGSGNVTIGSSTEATLYKLDVNGQVRTTGTTFLSSVFGRVAIKGLTCDESASLDLTSNVQGLGLPHLTIAQRDALNRGAASVVVTEPGLGYLLPPVLSFLTSPVGLQPIGTSTIDGSGSVATTAITYGGSYNIADATVVFSAPPTGGVRALGYVVMTGSRPKSGLTIFCTDAVAGDSSVGMVQTWNGTSWKNHWS